MNVVDKFSSMGYITIDAAMMLNQTRTKDWTMGQAILTRWMHLNIVLNLGTSNWKPPDT